MSPRHHIVFSKSSFSDDFRELVEDEENDILADHVQWVFEALEDAWRRTDPPALVVLNSNENDTWITSTNDAKTAHDLTVWCKGYAFALEEAFYGELARQEAEEPILVEIDRERVISLWPNSARGDDTARGGSTEE